MTQIMKITIPGNPVSVNNYLGTTKFGRKYLTKKAKDVGMIDIDLEKLKEDKLE